MYDHTILKEYLEQIQVPCTSYQMEQLDYFYELLIKKNEVMNLTAITEYNEFLLKHIADSLSILRYHKFQEEEKVLDLGTGAGFPGIPLKIFFPQTEMTLVDSVNKKLEFVSIVCEELGLNNVFVCHGRAEDLAHNVEFRGAYDYCVSRAVAGLPVLTELALGFVKKGGCFAAYKTAAVDEELEAAKNAIREMGGRIRKVEKFTLGTEYQRSIVFIVKAGNTPNKYPRKAGQPAKMPL